MNSSLLDPGVRALLPLRRQLRLYLDPCLLFRDASRGGVALRASALAHNRAMRWVLVAYLRRWLVIALGLFCGIAPAEALVANGPLFVLPAAAVAVGFCVAATVTFWIAALYLLLGGAHGRP